MTHPLNCFKLHKAVKLTSVKYFAKITSQTFDSDFNTPLMHDAKTLYKGLYMALVHNFSTRILSFHFEILPIY